MDEAPVDNELPGEQADDALAERPMRKDAARNRALLVAAAREVFAERGLEATLDDVARRAGLGVGTAYRHFANKYDLARAVLAEAIDGIVALIEDAGEIDDPWQALVTVVAGAAEAQSADRGLREVLTGVHDDEMMNQTHDRISAPLSAIVQRVKDAGLVRPDVEVSDVGLMLMMLCTVADMTAGEHPELWRRYVPMLLAGLAADVDVLVPAAPEESLRRAMSQHKKALRDGITSAVPSNARDGFTAEDSSAQQARA